MSEYKKDGENSTNIDFDSLKDEQTVLLSQQGNSRATDYILNKYTNFVRAKARTYYLTGGDKEDIIQEGMIGLFKAVRDFKSNSASFRSFAELCITRQIITAVKTSTRLKHKPLSNYISLSKPVYDGDDEKTLMDIFIVNNKIDPEEIMINKERITALENKATELLSKFELTVFLQYIEGFTYSKIAKNLGKSEKSIDNALQRIKKKIEKYFEEEF